MRMWFANVLFHYFMFSAKEHEKVTLLIFYHNSVSEKNFLWFFKSCPLSLLLSYLDLKGSRFSTMKQITLNIHFSRTFFKWNIRDHQQITFVMLNRQILPISQIPLLLIDNIKLDGKPSKIKCLFHIAFQVLKVLLMKVKRTTTSSFIS